jgi:hypothetical protein
MKRIFFVVVIVVVFTILIHDIVSFFNYKSFISQIQPGLSAQKLMTGSSNVHCVISVRSGENENHVKYYDGKISIASRSWIFSESVEYKLDESNNIVQQAVSPERSSKAISAPRPSDDKTGDF